MYQRGKLEGCKNQNLCYNQIEAVSLLSAYATFKLSTKVYGYSLSFFNIPDARKGVGFFAFVGIQGFESIKTLEGDSSPFLTSTGLSLFFLSKNECEGENFKTTALLESIGDSDIYITMGHMDRQDSNAYQPESSHRRKCENEYLSRVFIKLYFLLLKADYLYIRGKNS